MKKNLLLGIVIIFSIFFISHIISNGGDRLAGFLWRNYHLPWYKINRSYFLIAVIFYFVLFGLYNKGSKKLRTVILLIVPITTMGSIILLQLSFTSLLHYLYWSFLSFESYRFDIFLYLTGIITLILSFKVVINSNKPYVLIYIVALNTMLLFLTYLAYNDILASQTV